MPKSGDKLIIQKDCVCSYFTHECINYPRGGFRKENEPDYTLKKGEEVTFVKEWSNFYGRYYQVTKEGNSRLFDIDIKNF